MKLLACDRCLDVVALKHEPQSCSCGNISGKYLANDDDIEVRVLDRASARVIGLPNDVRYGRAERDECYVIPLDSAEVHLIQ